MQTRQQIAIPKTLTDYVEERSKIIAMIEHGHKAFEDAAGMCRELGLYGLPYEAAPRNSVEGTTRELDKRLWRQAFEKTNLLQVMDAQARETFERDLDRAPPAFTLENVTATFIEQYQSADDTFARGLVNVWKRLSGRYQTNEAFKLGEKIILDYMVRPSFRGGLEVGAGFSSRAGDTLNDIDRVFHILDGEAHTPRRFEMALNDALKAGDTYEDDYFRAKGFKKGTLHVWFKRLDLLEKGNRMIGDYYDGRAVPNDNRRAA